MIVYACAYDTTCDVSVCATWVSVWVSVRIFDVSVCVTWVSVWVYVTLCDVGACTIYDVSVYVM